jgi:hypothetical protein
MRMIRAKVEAGLTRIIMLGQIVVINATSVYLKIINPASIYFVGLNCFKYMQLLLK